MKIKPKWILMWILIIMVALIAVGLRSCFEPKPYSKEEWKQKYESKASNKLELDFKDIKTSKDTYEEMYDEIMDYANNNFGADKDEMEKQIDKLDKNDSIIYFNDSMLARFKAKDGKSNKIAANYINGSTVLAESLKVNYQKRGANNITESEYSDKVKTAIMELLKAKTDDDFNDAEERGIKYFTVDAKEKLLNSKSDLGIDAVTINSLAVNYVAIGKTDLSGEFNRVYIELDLGDKKSSILAKLNKYNKIYDFEIV